MSVQASEWEAVKDLDQIAIPGVYVKIEKESGDLKSILLEYYPREGNGDRRIKITADQYGSRLKVLQPKGAQMVDRYTIRGTILPGVQVPPQLFKDRSDAMERIRELAQALNVELAADGCTPAGNHPQPGFCMQVEKVSLPLQHAEQYEKKEFVSPVCGPGPLF